jgi:hypothetical protein
VSSEPERRPDFVEAAAEANAEMLEITARVKAAADRAVASSDVDELVASLTETIELLDAVVADLTGRLAEGAAIYANDPVFRRAVDEISDEDAG